MPLFGTGPKRTDGQTNSILNTTLTYLTPTQVPNLAVWFDAADTSTIRTNISSLNQWYSKTSISSVMSNAFGLPGPIWRSTTQNGLPVVRFDGTNSSFMSSISMTYDANTYVTNNETTMFLAYNPTNGGAPFGVTTNSYGGDGIRLHPQSGQTWFFGNINNLPNNARIDYSYPVNTGFKVESYFGRQGTLGARINGSLYAASTMGGGLSFPAGTNYHVQMGGVGYGSRLFTQDIGEALIYNRGLSDYELRGVEAYLARKWGTQSALPYRHPGIPTGPPLMGYKFLSYPAVVSNYGLWFDAMDTSTITDLGGNFPPLLPPNQLLIATWKDKSPNNQNISITNNPYQFLNLTGSNSYPTVIIIPNAPGGAYMRKQINTPYTGCNLSAFFVLGNTNNFFFTICSNAGGQAGANSPFDFNCWAGNSLIGFQRAVDGASATNNVINAPYTGQYSLVSMFVNGTQNTIGNVLPSTNLISINGAFVSSSTKYAGCNFNLAYMGLNGGYNFQATSQGNFSEIAIFYRTLTTPERFAIESQLIRKWGLHSNAPVSFINSLPVTSGLYGWYDAYDQTTVLRNASNNVSMWLDKSGQSNHMSTVLCTYGSNTGSNLYYSSINVSTNSFSALFFPSTFAVMRTSTLVVNQSFSTFSMISVGNFFKSNAGGAAIPRNVSLYSTLVANDMAYAGSVSNNAGGVNVANTNFTTRFSTLHINTMLVNLGPTTDTGIATGNALTYFNGVSNQTTTGLTYTGMIQPSYISLMGSGLTNSAGEGDFRNNSGSLAEVLLYNRILTSTELTNTHTYLLNKWGISNTICNVPVTSGLNLWLDAYDPSCVITDSNSNVLLWRDKSGLSNHFSNFTTNFPILTRNPQVNAPSISFNSNAITQALVNSNFNISSISSFSIVGVSLLSNTTVNGRIFSIVSTSQTLDFQNDNGFNIFNNNGTGFGYTRSTVILSNTVSSNINNMFSLIVNNSTIINDVNPSTTGFGTNGIMRSFSTTTTTSTLNVNLAYIGTSRNNDATSKFSGLMCELLYYNRVLSFPERQQVESYLMSKWNI